MQLKELYDEIMLPSVLELQSKLVVGFSLQTFKFVAPQPSNLDKIESLLSVLKQEHILKFTLYPERSQDNNLMSYQVQIWTTKQGQIKADEIAEAVCRL